MKIASDLVYFGVIALNPQIHPESKFRPNPMFWDKELSGGYITCSVADKLIQSLLQVTAQGVGRVVCVGVSGKDPQRNLGIQGVCL